MRSNVVFLGMQPRSRRRSQTGPSRGTCCCGPLRRQWHTAWRHQRCQPWPASRCLTGWGCRPRRPGDGRCRQRSATLARWGAGQAHLLRHETLWEASGPDVELTQPWACPAAVVCCPKTTLGVLCLQGMIMGPKTAFSMLVGAILGELYCSAHDMQVLCVATLVVSKQI
jgi:hypothetical protein